MQLEVWRKKEGVTLAALAAAVGTSRSHVWNIEKGKKHPSSDLAIRIEEFTRGGVTAASLLGLPERNHGARGVREDRAPFRAGSPLMIEVPVLPGQAKLLRESGLDISAIARAGAEKALKEAEAKAWAEANREAIKASNKWIEKYGTLAEQLGLI